MTASIKMRAQVTGAVLAAIALRLYFVLELPFTSAGDSPLYEALARNWLNHGIYGIAAGEKLTPVDIRAPGYPAFLAAIYALFGRGNFAVMLAQAAVDVLTCLLVAALAALLAPRESRRRVALAALWLAALCPFTANYTAVVLSETLAVFLTTLALVIFTEALAKIGSGQREQQGFPSKWLLGGIVAGLGALVRPETPLVLAAAGAVLLANWWRPRNWPKLIRTGVWMAVGLALPLLPWAARNWRTLGKAQFLAPRYSELPGEYVPRGFYAWTQTWLWRFRDVYRVPWNLGNAPIRIADIPASAFDSPAERAGVADLLAQYNETREMTPEVDRGFAEIARARTARHPLRTYLTVPFLRALSMWFTPRVEMLPYSGHLWPVGAMWKEDPVDFSVSLALAMLCIAYVAFALAGAWRARRHPAVAFLAAFVLIRTAFLTQIETPEPRYVLECFPAILALAAQLWQRASDLFPAGAE